MNNKYEQDIAVACQSLFGTSNRNCTFSLLKEKDNESSIARNDQPEQRTIATKRKTLALSGNVIHRKNSIVTDK